MDIGHCFSFLDLFDILLLRCSLERKKVKNLIWLYYFFSFDEKFFTFCDKELTKINTFYAEKLAEATRKFATLKSEMEESEKSSVAKKKVSIAILSWVKQTTKKAFSSCGVFDY